MKKLILICYTLALWTCAFTQQERQVSHYMYDIISVNPGSAGSSDMISTNAIMRQQWVGIDGAPSGLVVNLSAPIKIGSTHHGLGASFWQDAIGFNKDIDMTISYAYQFSLGNGRLGFGISGSYVNRKLDPEWIIPDGPGHSSTTEDQIIPTGNQNDFVFDLGAGLFYRTEELYVGISSTHLMQNEVIYQRSEDATVEIAEQLVRHYYLTAGYNFPLSNPALELLPSLMIQSTSGITKIDLNTTFLYNKKIWAGVTYRVGSAVVGMVGIEIFNGVRVGYSYDFDTSALSNFSKGSHEVMIGYNFTVGIDKIPQKYKSIRFL